MKRILVSDSERALELSLDFSRRQLDRILREVCGDESEVVYEVNLPNCKRHILEGSISGLIIPKGHGDYNTIKNLQRYLGGEIQVPII